MGAELMTWYRGHGASVGIAVRIKCKDGFLPDTALTAVGFITYLYSSLSYTVAVGHLTQIVLDI